MNLFKHITFVILIIIPINIFSQNLSVAEINSNSKIMSRAWIDVVSPDNSPFVGLFGNPALLTADKEIGITASHMDWIPEVMDKFNYRGLSSYFSVNDKISLGIGYKRFSMGEITFLDDAGVNARDYKMSEGEIKFAGAYKISPKISLGMAVNILYYRVDPDDNNTSFIQPSFDFGISFRDNFKYNQVNVNYGYAASVNSIGGDFKANPLFESRTNENISSFYLPTQLKVGGYVSPEFIIDEISKININLSYQVSKYLIPTSSIYERATYNKDISPFNGIIRSFSDSPDGFKGELNELNHSLSLGFDYVYNNDLKISVNLGRYFEHVDFGNRNFNSYGFEIGYKNLSFGVSKLSTIRSKMPLDEVTCYMLSYIYKLK